MSFSSKNDAESLCHFVKIPFLDPKRAKLDKNSDFRHVRTFSWLHKLRNTQRKIHGTYLGNKYIYIYIYGIYKEYPWIFMIWNNQKHRPNGAAAEGGRPIGSVFLTILHHKYLWIFLIDSFYISHIFSIYFPLGAA